MDLEARLHGAAPSEHPEALRLWLRLLTCTQLIEKQVRSHLRAQFDTTLPRFDLMAQLERAPHDGDERQYPRHHRPARGRGAGRAHGRGRRPPRVPSAPHAARPRAVQHHGAPARAMDRRSLRLVGRARHRHLVPPAGQGEGTHTKQFFGDSRMKHYIGASNPMREQFNPQASYVAEHFAWSSTDGVGTVTLNRPDQKNPLTFQSYAELRDFFYALRFATDVKAIVVTGAGGNFCSGGDVHEIIGPLTTMTMPELLEFTRMT